VWKRNWEWVIPFFQILEKTRLVIETTNAIESLPASRRKVARNRGSFPTEEAAPKLLCLEARNAPAMWLTLQFWREAMRQFEVIDPGRSCNIFSGELMSDAFMFLICLPFCAAEASFPGRFCRRAGNRSVRRFLNQGSLYTREEYCFQPACGRMGCRSVSSFCFIAIDRAQGKVMRLRCNVEEASGHFCARALRCLLPIFRDGLLPLPNRGTPC
jgi:hypothetical protein